MASRHIFSLKWMQIIWQLAGGFHFSRYNQAVGLFNFQIWESETSWQNVEQLRYRFNKIQKSNSTPSKFSLARYFCILRTVYSRDIFKKMYNCGYLLWSLLSSVIHLFNILCIVKLYYRTVQDNYAYAYLGNCIDLLHKVLNTSNLLCISCTVFQYRIYINYPVPCTGC